LKTQIWQAILRESDRFGFEPVAPHWAAAQRAAAMHDPRIPHFWWSEDVPSLVGFFTAGEAHTFAITLERIASVRKVPRLARARSPFTELIDQGDLSYVIDHARLGAFEWRPDQKGGTILVRGVSADSLTMIGNLGKVDAPANSPEVCDLTEKAEIRRLGTESHARPHVGANRIEITWWGWRAVLCVAAMEGMQPSDPEWQRWLRYYAYFDAERAHDWWNTGYLRISTFSERDTAMLKMALLKHLAQPDASLQRLQSYPAGDQPADALLALSSALIEEVRSVVDLCAHGSLCWTIYSDGIILLSGQ